MGLAVTVLAVFLLVPSFSLVDAFELPNNDIFSKWNEMLEVRLSDLSAAVTQIEFARSVYKSDSAISLEKVNGEKIIKSALEDITDFLQRKKTALKNLVNNAQENYAEFEKINRSAITLEDLSFTNMKVLTPEDEFTFSSDFHQKVSQHQSGVHIPLEIFDGYPEVLNGLNWTASLDKVFKENRKLDPTLKWQYFGSFFGFMRVYPAFRWPDHPSLPDLFDVRRRSWYIQGSVTPKDVIILIDRSGSVHGPTLDIIKITARALLNSLGENDYVNVAWFNNKVKWIIPCLKTLVQATAQVRRLLGDAVERLTESNLTSYATALDFAFETFKKFDENKKPWTGSNCHKIIMFLSDGGTEWPSDLVTKHCNESRNGRIKIFTFACGPHPIPTVVLKEMACATGGYFSPITALGSVRVKIQDYVKVLSRPLAYSEDDDMFRWHNFYRDVGGIGMVTAVTLPVFNKSHKTPNSTHLLGVMGIDIPIQDMIDIFSKYQLGPFGYPFAINTNGFVLFHPRLYDHIVYIEDPQNIYLTDLEGMSEEIEEMEKEMIDGLYGHLKNFKSVVPVGTGHAILVDMNFFYGPTESSIFRFGVAIPSNQMIAKVKISDLDTLATLLSTVKETLLAPWKFCPDDEPQDELTVEELSKKILTNYSYCDENLINHLLWDVRKVLAIQQRWNESNLPEVWSRFLITSSGMTTVHSSKLADEYQRQADPLKNNLYKKAISTPSFVFSVAKGSKKLVVVAKRIIIEDTFVTSVVGVEIEQEMVQNIFEDVTNLGDSEINCDSSEFLHCYLLNDGGIITASNVKTSKMGTFIGLHDPELLEALISKGILKKEYRYNYQSWCSKDTQPVQTMAAAHHMSIITLIYETLFSFHWGMIYSFLMYLISSVTAWKKVETPDTIDSANYSCVTRSAWYYHSGIVNLSNDLGCDENSRKFRASFLSNVTLIFIVSEPPCNNSLRYRPIGLDPEEDIEPQFCEHKEHYRLRPGKCYSKTPKNVFLDCGATSASHTTSQKTTAVIAKSLFFLLKINFVLRF